jgi:hypothetical protein
MAVLIFPKDNNDAKRLAKAVTKGVLKRIRQGIYTDATWEEVPQLLHNKWHDVVHALYPKAVASHVTAALLMPQNNVVHITANVKVRKQIPISDALIIEVHPGDVTQLIQPFLPTLFRSAPARFLLENLQVAHKDVAAPKSLGQEWVEKKLCQILELNGESELNQIRYNAKQYSETVGLTKEFKKLDVLIGAILLTRPVEALSTAAAISVAKQEPFDQNRIVLFKGLADYLSRCKLSLRQYAYNKSSWRNLSFYESYFSNYIEGTEFEIDEAEQIVFEKRDVHNRYQDSHDVLSVFDVVHDYTEMVTVPDSAEELMQLLKQRHALIMHARPDKRPGELKEKTNKAGDTLFVLPQKVEGTLTQAFPLYQQLPPGIARAIFIQFLVAECHPFDDGNGRLARIMMNAELVSQEQYKIIVPTVHRDSYLNGLRQATRVGRFRTITKVFADLQAYTSIIPWEEYGDARAMLQSHCADKLPDDGVAIFNKKIAQFKLALPAG